MRDVGALEKLKVLVDGVGEGGERREEGARGDGEGGEGGGDGTEEGGKEKERTKEEGDEEWGKVAKMARGKEGGKVRE